MPQLTDQELQIMLERAAEVGAEKALENWTNHAYQEVGKTVVKRCLQGLGALIIAAAVYAVQQGWVK